MKTSLEHNSRLVFGLRFGLVGFVLLGVITLLLMTNSGAAEAAQEITLGSGNLLIATPEGCNLSVLSSSQTKVRLSCEGWTPTGESATVESASDVTFAPDAKVYRTVKAGKKLSVLSTANVCKLKVVEETSSLVRIKCKPLPITVTPTRTPTPTKTRGPAMTNLWVGNYTKATLCFEVYGSGIGAQCWIDFTLKEIGSFPPGVYTYNAQAWCGSFSDTVNFPPEKVTLSFGCSSGSLANESEMSPEHTAPDALATPAR